MPFANRTEAGRRLGERLADRRAPGVVVLGLPRGGVPVAAMVAEALGAPLDVVVVRKLGAPFQPELALGAVGEGGGRTLNTEALRHLQVDDETLRAIEDRERTEVERGALRYRGGRPRVALEGRTAIIVDDGLATGATAAVACEMARLEGAREVVLAAPVGPAPTVEALRRVADEVIVLETPPDFFAVGQWYRHFEQTTDEEVTDLLSRYGLAEH